MGGDFTRTLRQLVVKMTPVAWIEARATDAETGKPVSSSQAMWGNIADGNSGFCLETKAKRWKSDA